MFYTDYYRIVKWNGTFTIQRQKHCFLWRWWVTQGRYFSGGMEDATWMEWSFNTLEHAKDFIVERLLKDANIKEAPEVVYYFPSNPS